MVRHTKVGRCEIVLIEYTSIIDFISGVCFGITHTKQFTYVGRNLKAESLFFFSFDCFEEECIKYARNKFFSLIISKTLSQKGLRLVNGYIYGPSDQHNHALCSNLKKSHQPKHATLLINAYLI